MFISLYFYSVEGEEDQERITLPSQTQSAQTPSTDNIASPTIARVVNADGPKTPAKRSAGGNLTELPVKAKLVLGCNDTQWGPLTCISTITQAARDTRLANYLQHGMPAYTALQERDMVAIQSLDSNSVSPKEKGRVRRQVATAMRMDPTFLGGQHELGMALQPLAWKPHKPCYACFGMMGYQQVKYWSEKEQNAYMARFD